MIREQIVYNNGELSFYEPDAIYVASIKLPMNKTVSKNTLRKISKLVRTGGCTITPNVRKEKGVSISSSAYMEDIGYVPVGVFNGISLYVGQLDIEGIDVVIINAVKDNVSVRQVIVSPQIHGYNSNEEFFNSLIKKD